MIPSLQFIFTLIGTSPEKIGWYLEGRPPFSPFKLFFNSGLDRATKLY